MIICFDFGVLDCVVLQKSGFVTPANVVEIFHENDVPKDFDMLSLDTDGFEWLLWLKLQKAGDFERFVKDRGFLCKRKFARAPVQVKPFDLFCHLLSPC